MFTYQVAREKSHYFVDYCCIASEAATAVANMSRFHEIVGYHGEMAVDPEKGSILRISLFAELKSGSPVTRADLLVDFAPVEIGGQPYICPAKGISITTAQMVQVDPRLGYPLARQLQPLKTMLNEVKFQDYHVFRAESRVLTAASDTPAPPADHPMPAPASEAPTTTDQFRLVDEAAATPAPSTVPTAATESTAPPAPAPESAPVPEISFAADAALPETPALAFPPGAPSGYRLRTTTRLVDIGLVAFDKKGHPLTDLKQTDFEIYDNGRKQGIKHFEQASQAEPQVTAPAASDAPARPEEVAFSNRQTPRLEPRTAPSDSHSTILMIDSSSLAWADLQYARQEMLRFLNSLPQGEPVGLYILRSYGFQDPSRAHDRPRQDGQYSDQLDARLHRPGPGTARRRAPPRTLRYRAQPERPHFPQRQ